MAGIPITRMEVSPEKAEAIRACFRAPARLSSPDAHIITLEDAVGFLEFLSDPRIHAPIYTLPSPLTLASVTEFIAQHIAEQAAGEGLMFVRKDASGRTMSYSDIQVWPHWGACELGGAIHPDWQGVGAGIEGARASFEWLFREMQIELICETAAVDNIRTARLLDGLGFRRMGEVESVKPDGSTRASLAWEVTKGEWLGT